jgi:hypothetical protein
MHSTILLNSSENTHQVEREEQGRFVHSILSAFNVPLEDWEGEELTTEQHMKLRKILSAFKIEVISDMDGGIKIYCEGDKKYELIAEFKKPRYVLRKDAGNIDPNKRNYLEMILDTWSILEETK